MLDRPRSGERALLLHVGLNRPCHADETEEFRALAESAGAEVVAEIQARRDRPDPKYFIGSGKVEEIAGRARATHAELILVNQPLKAGQERNLEITQTLRGVPVNRRITVLEARVGDLNCDGRVDFGDINPFVQILSDPAGWQADHPACPASNGDLDSNGNIDFGDINPFVALLSGSK